MIFDYIAFRAYEHFLKKKGNNSKLNTILYLWLLEVIVLYVLFFIIQSFLHLDTEIIGINGKYYIGLPLAIISHILNNFYFNKSLKGENFEKLKNKYHKEKYTIHFIYFIILIFVLFLLVPIIYGALNGTLRIVRG